MLKLYNTLVATCPFDCMLYLVNRRWKINIYILTYYIFLLDKFTPLLRITIDRPLISLLTIQTLEKFLFV